jgi:drug/metabolite transporter (DMT)-like permease
MPLANTIGFALFALILGNLFASLSDVAVKLLDKEASVYQYVFLRQLIGALVIAPFYLLAKSNNKYPINWKVTAIRSHLIIIGAGCMVVAITHLPLATANAVFYAGPLLMLPLSVLILGENLEWKKVLASLVGFSGVLIVLRPSQFHWAAYFALGTAMSLALFHVLVRKLSTKQPVLHTLYWTSIFSLPVSGVFAFLNWQPLGTVQYFWITASSLLILGYNGLAVLAYKNQQANQIALAEYSGLAFVTIFGVWWFDEIPDIYTVIGILLIILPLLPRKKWRTAKKTRAN